MSSCFPTLSNYKKLIHFFSCIEKQVKDLEPKKGRNLNTTFSFGLSLILVKVLSPTERSDQCHIQDGGTIYIN